MLAQAKKMPRPVIRREPQVIEPEHHHARSPLRPVERRLPRQGEVRHPFIYPGADVGTPQVLVRVLPVPRRNAALGFQHLARAAVNLPTNVKRQLRFHTHGSSEDRKSTRLNSSHVSISYAVFCLKKKKTP